MASSVFIWPGPIVFISPILAPAGSISAPSVGIGVADTGWYQAASGDVRYATGGNDKASFSAATGLVMPSNVIIGFASAAQAVPANLDINISRVSPNVLAIGTGVGDFTGTLKLATLNAVTSYQANGSAGVATFGPAAVASITVKQGIVTAIS